MLVAAGNSGRNGPASVGSPASAKNCLSVGATMNAGSGGGPNDMAVFSSIGPVQTGQIGAISAPALCASYCLELKTLFGDRILPYDENKCALREICLRAL